jgi:hypothetical protein
MRYLKVIAQDRSGKGAADTVHFEFFEDDQLRREGRSRSGSSSSLSAKPI